MEPIVFQNTGIDRNALDDDAVKVVGRLRRKGHEAFLVGGCVRDLLLHRRPKDFDVATSARPRQIKSLFRNCRIIGRRFKLAHLYFESKVIEVSTFRCRPEPDEEDDDGDLLIRSDNAFGTAREDATRRDFTINGLFLDPKTIEIHDYVDGIRDIGTNTVRTIGEPLTRIKEDPVRILRAIKFASRLSLEIEPGTWKAMCDASGDLSKSAPPRVLEEILRLLRAGRSVRSFQLLRDCGALDVLIPEVSSYLRRVSLERRRSFWQVLEAVDSLVRQVVETGLDEFGGRCSEVSTPILIGSLLFPLFASERAGDEEREDALVRGREIDLGRFAEDFFSPILRRLNLSRAESGRLKRICVSQRRFVKQKSVKGGRSRGFRIGNFVRQDYFPEALSLYRLRCLARDGDWDEYDAWLARYRETTGSADVETDASSVAEAGPSSLPRGSKTRSSKSGRTRSSRTSRSRTGSDDQASTSQSDEQNGQGTKKKAKKGRSKAKTTASKKRSRTRKTRVAELPPLPEIELDPSEVPTYGSVVGDTGSAEKIELEASKSKKARRKQAREEAPYVPPPPPEDKTDEEEPDTFGDW